MSGRGKRLWAPRLGFDEAYREVLEFLKNSGKHNLIGSSGSTAVLYHAYWMDTSFPTEGLIDASSVLKFGYDRSPTADQAKQAMAKLLSVATKAHFFLAPKAIVVHEPYIFVMPDLGNPGQRRYGLIYPLENNNRLSTIVVAEWDLALASSRQPKLQPAQKFPVVLQADHFQWLALKHWRTLKESAGDQPWFDNGPARNRLLAQVRNHTDPATFDYGHCLSYPKELNDEVKAVGAMWAKGIRQWFLPKGWDIKAVKEYLDQVSSLTPQEHFQHRWWTARPYPKGPADNEEG